MTTITLPCQEAGPDVFYGPTDPGDSEPGEQPYPWEWRAVDLCWDCPVVSECLAEALNWPEEDQHGVVGGMTAGQRRAALQHRGGPAADIPPGVDPLTVEHLVAGVAVPGASRIDVAHAAVQLYATGLDCTQTAVLLRVRDHQVQRWVSRHQSGLPMVADARRRAS